MLLLVRGPVQIMQRVRVSGKMVGGPRLLGRSFILPLKDGITFILSTSFPGMNDECKGDKILDMTGAGGLDRTKLQIIDGVVEAVRAHYNL